MNKQKLLNMIGELVLHAEDMYKPEVRMDDRGWLAKYNELSQDLFDAIATSPLPEGAYDVPVYACRHWNEDSEAYDLEVFELLTDNLVDVIDIAGLIAQREWCEDRFITFYED